MNISKLLESRAEEISDGLAILAKEKRPLTYNELYLQSSKVLAALRGAGIGRKDRVGIVLPNGPEMAVAFLTVSACVESAPLNPAYRSSEFAFYLSDLKPKALVVHSSIDSPARAVARDLGISIIELLPEPEGKAGMFRLKVEQQSGVCEEGFAQSEDVAVILHTSGTTSRPKIVPLSQGNVCSSARNIARSLGLATHDRCLNVMPLFHIHGLIGALLSSIFAGASVVCCNDFYSPEFFEWMKQFDPTWYTAVPTMHQAILSRAKQNVEIIANSHLRFIRSSSAPLPRQVLHELEASFHVPVLEAYGMTEASHQISTNPLPPGKCKPGSVGLAAGPEVSIMNDSGDLLSSGETGEIVIRGSNVTSGYQNNPDANRSAFHDGWFRTGDEGHLDQDGYLFITCRRKEIINRGGEKISPYEVEEALLAHANVKEAVCFAFPEAKLGEDVAAAVVLRENLSANELELREFASMRLADFKVPKHVFFLKELPKGSTGKLQRLTLAEQLGLKTLTDKSPDRTDFVEPVQPLEKQIAEIWKQVLGLAKVGVNDNFFYLGGDSILATRIVFKLNRTFQREISLLSFLENPTVAELSAHLKNTATPESSAEFSAGKECVSFAQEQIWFYHQLYPDGFIYNRPAFLRFRGHLNISVLERCLTEIVNRHDSLRTTIQSPDGAPLPVITPASSVHIDILDLTHLPEEKREAEVLKLAIKEVQKPFNLKAGPLFRMNLLKLAKENHVLQMTFHHIAFDDWSMNVLFDEFSVLYEAYSGSRESPLPELTIDYSDFVRHQRNQLHGEAKNRLVSFWRQQLANLTTLQLPLKRPRPPIQTFRGAQEKIQLSAGLSASIRKLARDEHATLFMVLLGAFQVILARYTGQEDIPVGIPTRGRNKPEFENLIGVFINTIVFRSNLSGDPSFRDLLRRIRDVAFQSYAHQDLPFQQLVKELRPERNLSRSPLFQVMFQLRNVFERQANLPNLKMEEYRFDPGIAGLDLTLEVMNGENQLLCLLIYNTDLFDSPWAVEMLRHYETLLEGIAANPDDKLSSLMTRLSFRREAPVSHIQEAFWLSNQLFPDRPLHNLLWELKFSGRLDSEKLQDSLQKILERHEVLRATYSFHNGEVQQLFVAWQPFDLQFSDISGLESQERKRQEEQSVREFGLAPFDLENGPLIRFYLIRTETQQHSLLVAMHHIVTDGPSWPIFVKDLLLLYQGNQPPLPPVSYGEFAQWQRKMIHDGWQEHEAFWKNKFEGVQTLLEIPADHSRSSVRTHSGGIHECILSSTITDQLRAMRRKEGTTTFRMLIAAFIAFLSRITGRSDLMIGTTLTGRDASDFGKLIGPMNNQVALRLDLVDDPPFLVLLDRVHKELEDAIQHQLYPFAKAVHLSKSMKELIDLSVMPVNFTKLPRTERRKIGDLEIEDSRKFLDLALNDLSVYSQEVENEIRLTWIYSSELFEQETIARLSGLFQTLLEGILLHPEERISRAPLLTTQERNQLLFQGNGTKVNFPRHCIHQLFELQAEQTPHAVALIFEDKTWTYKELNEQANRLANTLRDRGVGPEQMVGLCMERSSEMIWGLIGILKAGAAYVPLDPTYPKARLKYILEDTQLRLLLTQETLKEDLPQFGGEVLILKNGSVAWLDENRSNPKAVNHSNHLAYVMYTSGSTGKPKGVMAIHSGVANYLHALQGLAALSLNDVVLQITSLSFDPSVRSIFGPLSAGARILLPSETEAAELQLLASRIREQGVTCILSIVPTFLRTFVDAVSQTELTFPSVRLIVISGEPLVRSLCEKAQHIFPNALMMNKYGPTECTMTSTYYWVPPSGIDSENAPIGEPIANCQVYVLDRNLEPAPIGVPGELHIGGAGVTRGYLNQADLTEKAFIPDPFSNDGSRLYKTGDLVRYLPDGNLDFLGRIDQQLKVHGVRIEAGEVEAALDEHEAVKESVVVAREVTMGDKILVAYVVLLQQPGPGVASLRRFLKERLPDFMIPSHFVFLQAVPHLPNGKVDLLALAAPEKAHVDADSLDLKLSKRPFSFTELQLFSIWSEVLNEQKIGPEEDFFDIGGHSLSAIQILSRIHQRLGINVSIREFFNQASIAAIAALIDSKRKLVDSVN